MARLALAIRVFGGVLVATAVICVLWGLSLGFYIEGTTDALYRAEVGVPLRRLAWIGLPLGVVAIVIRRPAVGGACLIGGVAFLGGLALSASDDLDPEAGERRVMATFVPPPGSTPGGVSFSGFSFPTLSAGWVVSGSEGEVCEAARLSLTRWSETVPRRQPFDGCGFTGTRDGHDGTVYVREDYRDPSMSEVSFTVTRRV